MNVLSSIRTPKQVTYQNKKNEDVTYEKPSVAYDIAAGYIGCTVNTSISNILNKAVKRPLVSDTLKTIENTTKENSSFKDAIEKAFNNSKLAEKGCSLREAANVSDKEIDVLIDKEIPSFIKRIPKVAKQVKQKNVNALKRIREGKNAAFLPKNKKILVNSEKMAAATFHEMGHALNFNTNGVGKILSKMRKPGLLLLNPIVLIAAFKPHKCPEEQTKGAIDKTTTFVKNNAGTLGFLTALPIILEEGLASVKAAKLAKPVLSKDAYKMLNKMNKKAWLTYLSTGIILGIGAKAASLTHDLIASPKRVKTQQA